MKQNCYNKQSEDLFKIIAKIKTKDEAAKFFRDLCTLEELRAMSERWQAVLLLDKGLSYREIAKKTGLSTTTVTRVSHWLNHGEGGYTLMLNKK